MADRIKKTYHLNDSVKAIIQIIDTEPPFRDAPLFNSTLEKCRTLWLFVKNNINYRNDSEGIEEIRTPKRTWLDRKKGVDCEDYCIFLCSILLKNDIKPLLRIVSFNEKDGFAHIYVVVKDNGQEIILDCCMDEFNAEVPYLNKIDIEVLKPNYSLIPKAGNYKMQVLSGIPEMSISDILKYEGKGGKGKEVGSDAGILTQYFTPDWIIELMWKLVVHYGFMGGKVLEPSCGTGRFMYYGRPKMLINFYAFEREKELAQMAQKLVPDANIYNDYFETAFLEKKGAFYHPYKQKDESWLPKMDLVIGNPPYGIWKNQFSGMFNLKGINQLEQFFMLQGLKLLKKDGLMCYITASNFASTYDKYYQTKKDMDELCTLVDAYRLPSVFKSTDAPTDILIFRRK